ncbi:MAG: PAS domain S-box protein, partial [Promethearchaeia archaeon]
MRRANEKISSLKHHFEGDLTNFVQTLLKNLDSKILVANKNDKLIFMNRSMKQLIQMDFTDVNSETLLGDLSAEIIENLNPYFEKAKEKLIPTKFNSIMFPAASDNTSASGKLVPLVVETQYKGMICIFERISKLSRNLSSFEKRKDTGVNFKLVYEKSPYSIIITNLNGDIKYLNPAFEELLGYERRNLLEANVFQINIYVEDSLEILRKEYNKFLQMGHKNYPLEFKIRKKDGKIIWIELDAEFIYQENNTYIISFLKDISNRKEIELALQYSERRFRQLLSQYQTFLEIISDPIYVLNENLKFQLINSTGCKAVGMKETDLLYQKITDLFPGIKQTLYYRAYRKVLKTGQKETIIKNFVHPDGQKSLYEVRIFPIPKGILCIARDITELNLIKTQLKESEQKFRTIAEQSLLGIAIIQNNEVKYMNETYAQIYGYTVGEMKKWTIKEAKNAIHPADRGKVINKLIKKQNGSDHVKKHYQYRAITKDGDIRWLDNYSKSIIYKEKPANLVTIIDITKRKKIEEKLRYQAELVENVSDAVISMDIHFHILSWNNAAEKIYGWKEEEVLGRRIDRLLKIKFLRSTKEEVLSEFDKEGSWKGEVIQSHKNGSKLYIYSSINIFRDKLTENLRIVSTNRDISQRKQAERKLKESEEKFRTITEQSVIGVHILKNSKTVYLNNALTNIFESPKSIMQNWK